MRKQRKKLKRLLGIVLTILFSGLLQLGVALAATTQQPDPTKVELTSSVAYSPGSSQLNIRQGETISFNINISVPADSLNNINQAKDANIIAIDTLYSVDVNAGITVGASGNKGRNNKLYKNHASYEIEATATVALDAKPGIYHIPIVSYRNNNNNNKVDIVDNTTDYVVINVLDIAPTLLLTKVPNPWTNNGSVNFEWSGSDYDTPSSDLQYSWQLITNGNEGTWTPYTKNNTAYYTELQDGNYTFKVKVKDSTGSVTSAEYNFGVDTAKPIVNASPDRAANAKGWYNDSVTVSFSATDDHSGVAQVDPHVILDTEGTNQQVNGHAIDNAGNIGTGGTSLSIDKTPPVVTFENLQDEQSFEANELVNVIWNASDPISGIESASGTQSSGSLLDTSSLGSKQFTVTATDKAGNTTTKTLTYSVQDTTAPDVLFTQELEDWRTSDTVNFAWEGSDNYTQSSELLYSWQLDGGAWSAYNGVTTASLSGLKDGDHTFNVKAKDIKGNESEPLQYSFGVDTEKPVVMVSPDRLPNTQGWYNDSVTVSFSATDEVSKVATVDQPVIVDSEGQGQEFTGKAVDNAGNVGTGSISISVDKTAPTVTIQGIEAGATYQQAKNIVVNWKAEDSLSGIASVVGTVPSGSAVDTSSPGTKQFTVTATDKAGNTTTKSVTYYVTALTVTSPTDNFETSETSINLKGEVQSGYTLRINGVVTYPYNGTFIRAVDLKPGTNIITITATDQVGNVTTVTRTVKRPVVIVNSPANNLQTNNGSVSVTGVAAIGSTVTVNEQPVTLDTKGNFSVPVVLKDGSNAITVAGVENNGYKTTTTVNVIYDTTPPMLNISSPANNIETTNTSVNISGQVELGSTVRINGVITYPYNGTFIRAIELKPGTNVITFTATDQAGNVTTVTRTVKRPVVVVNTPTNNLQTNKDSVTLTGVAAIGSTVTVNGQGVTLDAKGNFTVSLALTDGNNAIVVVGEEQNGYKTNTTINVIYDTTPPQLTIDSPSGNTETTGTSINISGQAEVGSTVRINGAIIYPYNGIFIRSVNLLPGTNVITFTATDLAGNITTVTRMITKIW